MSNKMQTDKPLLAKQSWLEQKSIGLSRQLLIRGIGPRMPYFVINEYPRSGGTWLGEMLAYSLDVPFPRNRFPLLQPSIMHGHYYASQGIRKPILLWRDGRDVLVSWYFFNFARFGSTWAKHVQKKLNISDWQDVEHYLPRFLEMEFNRQGKYHFHWGDFVKRWDQYPGSISTRYEALSSSPHAELASVVGHFTEVTDDVTQRISQAVENNRFAKQTGRSDGSENQLSGMRKGIVGDWKNKFSAESIEIFEHYAGDQLRQLGYAK